MSTPNELITLEEASSVLEDKYATAAERSPRVGKSALVVERQYPCEARLRSNFQNGADL